MNIFISKVNFLGDAITFLPTLQGIVENIQDATLFILTTPVGRQVFEGSVSVSKFFVYDYHKFRALWRQPLELYRLASQIRQLRCELALFSFDEPSSSYLLSLLAGIERRVGFRSDIARLNFLLTERLSLPLSKNVVDINFDLIRWATGNKALLPKRVRIAYTEQEKVEVDNCLLAKGISLGSPFVVMHPFAKLPYREWAISRYLELAALLEKQLSIPVLFVSEVHRPEIGHNIRLVSGLSVKGLACLLERAIVFVGNNSGPMHLAAAMGTPTVTIQGPTAPQWDVYWKDAAHVKICSNFPSCIPCERFGHVPGRCFNKVYPHGCLKEIDVGLVFHQVSAVLHNLSETKRSLNAS
jgi:ADP-heptose:LPS heptosyltransferase